MHLVSLLKKYVCVCVKVIYYIIYVSILYMLLFSVSIGVTGTAGES